MMVLNVNLTVFEKVAEVLVRIGETSPVVSVCKVLVALIKQVQQVAHLADDLFTLLRKLIEIARSELAFF